MKQRLGERFDLQVVADIAGISVDDLYELNPAFHRWATDPTGPYRLLVPSDAAEGLQETILHLTPGQRMRVDHYTVRRGDTIATIARNFATRPEVIRELNDLGDSDLPVIDAELRVPALHIQLPEKVARAALLFDSPTRVRRGGRRPKIHVVRRGDTLYATSTVLALSASADRPDCGVLTYRFNGRKSDGTPVVSGPRRALLKRRTQWLDRDDKLRMV